MITQTLFWGTYNLGLGLIDIFFKGLGANLIFLGFRPFFWAIAEFPMFFFTAYISRKYSPQPAFLISFQFLTLKLIVYYFFMTPQLIWVDLLLQTHYSIWDVVSCNYNIFFKFISQTEFVSNSYL